LKNIGLEDGAVANPSRWSPVNLSQNGSFCSSWNKESTSEIEPSILLSPNRLTNGPIRNLLSKLSDKYSGIYSRSRTGEEIPPSLPSDLSPPPTASNIIPEVKVSRNRVTLILNLGTGPARRRKIEDLHGLLDPSELRNYLLNARIWEVKIS